MQPVAVRILHPEAAPTAGPLERALVDARARNAERLATAFREAGADDVRVERGGPDSHSFGERLRRLVATAGSSGGPAGGLVVLGSGALPLATGADVRAFVAVAGSGERRALANGFYSADVVAAGAAAALASVPDIPSDNALPRWLADEAGFEVSDLRRRWRLGVDLDSPLDVLLVTGGLDAADPDWSARVADRRARLQEVAQNPRAQLLVAGRASAATLRWLERSTRSRTRALIEERGLRAIGMAGPRTKQRRPRSVLGLVLDDRGPGALGAVLAELGDAAVVDSRVLLAHRLGADEAAWPAPEDRFAADLLLADRIRDPWLRDLTAAALAAPIPVLLGGHTLVGPGLRLALGGRR